MNLDNTQRPLSEAERCELDSLVETLRATSPSVSRRDLLRFSAVAAGAVASARFGIASAATQSSNRQISRDQQADIEQNATINVPLDPYGQAVTLDPHRTVNWGPFWVMFPNIWGGLMRYDENGKVSLDLAESFKTNADGTVYEFKIRPDAKYANGNKVVAGDFVASWKRALNPTRLSPMASFMAQVKGYSNFVKGKSEDIGFAAPDDVTVSITLAKPYTFFPSYLAAFVWSVVDPTVIEKEGDAGFALADAGTGPWRVTSFDPATQLVMEPNPNYYGGASPSITKIVWPFVTGPSAASTALNLYKQDQAISADVPISLKSTVDQDPELSKELVKIAPEGSTRSFAMDFKQPPFDDVRIRRAIALGLDRETIATQIWEGTWRATTAFTPPVVAQISGYQPPDGIAFNADEAKQLLQDAGFPEGKGLPPITYFEPSEDTDDEKTRWKQVFDNIRTATGVDIAVDASKTTDEISQAQADNGGRQFDVVWWWNTTETPHLLSEVFRTGSRYMKGAFNWSEDLAASGDFDPGGDAKRFNDLTAQADVEQDAAKRNDLYRQAEELVLKNAVYVPIGNWVQMFVQKPYVQGTRQGPWTGRIPVLFDKDVVVLKHS